ncbi:MAG TPA: hypothetical protein VMV86_00525 [Methanosarcinales archaeon]|nr:hypothetical protein [Methanosarcinales archaeon]
MGGKSRKSGGVSRALINKLIKSKSGKDNSNDGKSKKRKHGLLPESSEDKQ